MSGRKVVKRYVTALILAAEEADLLDAVEADIRILAEIMEEPEIRAFCLRTGNSRKTGTAFIRTAFLPYVGEYTRRFVTLLVENGRIAALPFAGEAFDEIIQERKGTVTVLLETPREADPELVKQVKEGMEERLGKTVNMKKAIVPILLGGFRIIRENRMIDRSVRGRLKKMRMLLKQE